MSEPYSHVGTAVWREPMPHTSMRTTKELWALGVWLLPGAQAVEAQFCLVFSRCLGLQFTFLHLFTPKLHSQVQISSGGWSAPLPGPPASSNNSSCGLDDHRESHWEPHRAQLSVSNTHTAGLTWLCVWLEDFLHLLSISAHLCAPLPTFKTKISVGNTCTVLKMDASFFGKIKMLWAH